MADDGVYGLDGVEGVQQQHQLQHLLVVTNKILRLVSIEYSKAIS